MTDKTIHDLPILSVLNSAALIELDYFSGGNYNSYKTSLAALIAFLGTVSSFIQAYQQSIFGNATNSGNAYSVTLPNITTLYAGLEVNIHITGSGNTGPATLQINSLTAKNMVKFGTTVLNSGDLILDGVYKLVYDGFYFKIMTPTNNIVDAV